MPQPENAEYHAARDQQGLMEARIRDIEGKLSNCQVINPAELNAGGKVVFGATVEIVDEDSRDETTYQIVGEDIKAGRISYSSPIARALIGKEEGDVVTVATPGGTKSLEIVAVRYE